MPQVNPGILQWARETAGLSHEEAAKKIQLKDNRKKTGVQQLEALESGEKAPSRSQLNRIANAYHQPLLVFYLDRPPRRGDRGADFRTAPAAAEVSRRDSSNLDILLRNIKTTQGLLKSLREEETDIGELGFIGSEKMASGAEKVAQKIVRSIDFDLQKFRQAQLPNLAFRYLRTKIEETGIFVIQAGNLGSYHTNIPPQIFRGFALADPVMPLVVINPQDSHSAQSFTALHEVAHLWLGETGLSPSLPIAQQQGTESFCNQVAANILLPPAELEMLEELKTESSLDVIADRIRDFAEERNISRSMVAYALQQNRMIDKKTWQELYRRFYAGWRASRKGLKSAESEGGPNYYTIRKAHLGEALLSFVGGCVHNRVLSYTKAAIILGISPRNVPKLLSHYLNSLPRAQTA